MLIHEQGRQIARQFLEIFPHAVLATSYPRTTPDSRAIEDGFFTIP
jgi:hypothetical protein